MVTDGWPSNNSDLVRQIHNHSRVVIRSIVPFQSISELNHVLERIAGCARLAVKCPLAEGPLRLRLENGMRDQNRVLRHNKNFVDDAICANPQTSCNRALYSCLACHRWITSGACQMSDTNVSLILCLSISKKQNWQDRE
jgi:hypothetical protein